MKIITLPTGEVLRIDEDHVEGVFVLLTGHRTQVSYETVEGCLLTFAAQFLTLATELENLAARAKRGDL